MLFTGKFDNSHWYGCWAYTWHRPPFPAHILNAVVEEEEKHLIVLHTQNNQLHFGKFRVYPILNYAYLLIILQLPLNARNADSSIRMFCSYTVQINCLFLTLFLIDLKSNHFNRKHIESCVSKN